MSAAGWASPPVAVLVVAKAPVPGQVKTRLATDLAASGAGRLVGRWAARAAADLAALALLDTMHACGGFAAPERRHLALSGTLEDGTHGGELRRALAGWQVRPQLGADFADRLAAAHAGTPGPAVQIGMDTPQVTAADLAAAGALLEGADAVLGPAADGGWWLLGLRDPRDAQCLVGVPMSTPETAARTEDALLARGLTVARAHVLRDVDRAVDADAVAAESPDTRFAAAWRCWQKIAEVAL
ncbi:DUF2064 domain-containing protein [Nocardioides sp. GY 10113]|uniref:TIGR04282 family arsenosugar biosynthesis glycosyltransferase n=1 Tax=Nocardioides sp. GY 10113 TaxID=2569761 RepID=UPI0010A88499|nr:DUF2064 domain-containing protein [Nocardioides sp. GY 10113]TIC80654.1 DUF2064 domain-containing protein [Nocardioides sp. GY 10113]